MSPCVLFLELNLLQFLGTWTHNAPIISTTTVIRHQLCWLQEGCRGPNMQYLGSAMPPGITATSVYTWNYLECLLAVRCKQRYGLRRPLAVAGLRHHTFVAGSCRQVFDWVLNRWSEEIWKMLAYISQVGGMNKVRSASPRGPKVVIAFPNS